MPRNPQWGMIVDNPSVVRMSRIAVALVPAGASHKRGCDLGAP